MSSRIHYACRTLHMNANCCKVMISVIEVVYSKNPDSQRHPRRHHPRMHIKSMLCQLAPMIYGTQNCQPLLLKNVTSGYSLLLLYAQADLFLDDVFR